MNDSVFEKKNNLDVYEYMLSSPKESFESVDIRASLGLSINEMIKALSDLLHYGIVEYSNRSWILTAKGKKEIKA